jgi:radical SAM superfamily enzyme YgiQ (UPF0313 family)
MRITFIKPNMGLVGAKPYYDRGRMEPLTFAVMKGLTPPEHEVVLYDDRFEAVPYDEPTDLVAINTEVYTVKRAYEIADQFREREVKVVLGGYHTTLAPRESAQHADAVVVGDSEPVWPQILEDAAGGRLKPLYRGCTGGEGVLDGISTDWSIFSGKSYLPVRLTQFSRGCFNRCEYCATGNIYQRSHRHRPVEQVVRELARDGSRSIFFVDDNIVADKEAATALFRALIPLKIRWFSQADLSFTTDPALMDLMLESGCMGLVVGFESLDRDNLEQMNKNCNLGFESYDAPVERIRAAGLQVWAAFLLGYDSETVESVHATCSWALEKKFAFSAFNILMPYPNTPFYERVKAEGRLLYDGRWWLHDDYRFGWPGFRPKHCSADDLAQACLDARLRHNTVYQIFRRSTDRKTHMKNLISLATYFAYNPLFRDEMLKKHGMQLGYRGVERPESFEADHPIALRLFEEFSSDPLSKLLNRPADWIRQILARVSAGPAGGI